MGSTGNVRQELLLAGSWGEGSSRSGSTWCGWWELSGDDAGVPDDESTKAAGRFPTSGTNRVWIIRILPLGTLAWAESPIIVTVKFWNRPSHASLGIDVAMN